MSVQRQYLDFEVKIDDLGGERYRATVIDMPLGEGQAQVSNDFTLPFSADDLNRILAILSGRLDVSNAERQRQARTFGEALFKAVFAGPVYTVYFSSRDRAQSADGLRVKLFLENAGPIANLPWELLRDPGVDFLALSRSTPLIRHPRSLVIRSRPVFRLPLRVLVMISSPSDLEPVDAKTEWENLQAAVANLREQNLLELDLLEDASLRTLQRMMRTREYHVFHYIGHSTFDPATGQGMLALEDPFGEGSSFPVRGEDLARELGEENTIRLVVMNSCQSAVDLEGDPFAGIASSLVARGIPAVVAMQNVISEQAARVFSDELYRAVAEGLPVDAGVSEARRAINNVVGGIEWATPVLFMRAADGMLFDFGRKDTPVAAAFRKPAVLASIIGSVVLLVILLIAGLIVFDGGNGVTPTPIPAMDLAVDSVEVFPSRPAPGEKAGVFVAISNQSNAPVGKFGYDFRQDVLDQDVNLAGMINGLAPGDRVTVLIPHYFTWWGAFVSEVRIDVGSDVPETDEFNNISRYPIVTSSDPFAVLFDVLPSGAVITESMPLTDDTFATWNFRLVATGDPGCENAVPWIIVDGDNRYLGTGLLDTPESCTNARLSIVFDDRSASSVTVQFEAVQPAEYSLTAQNHEGEEIDRVSESFADGIHELDVLGGMGNRQDIAAVVFSSGAPARILRVELTEPAQLGLGR